MEIDKINLHAVLYALGELKAYKTLSNMERNDAIEAMNKLNSNGINLSFIFTEVKNNDIILPKKPIDEFISEVNEKLEEYESSNGSNGSRNSSSNNLSEEAEDQEEDDEADDEEEDQEEEEEDQEEADDEEDNEEEEEDDEEEEEDDEEEEEELQTSSLSEEAESDIEDEDRVPKIHTEKFAIYVHSHGKNVLNKDTRVFETFESPINVTKITACGLCDILVSANVYDYFIPVFINEIDKDYTQEHPNDTIFNHPRLITEVTRYIICKIHPEMTCRLSHSTIQRYDSILSKKPYSYPAFIKGIMHFRHDVPYYKIIDILLKINRSCPTNISKHTTRHNISKRQRNKIYTAEKGENTLDIIGLMPYYNQAYGIKIKRGDSLLQFFYKYRKRNKGLVDRIIRQFDPEGIMPEEHNFTPLLMSSAFKKFPNKNITSISLKFLLFFFEKIGIRNITVIDFSCGVVSMNRDENQKQGWTDSSSASSRSASRSNKSSSLEIGSQLKEGEDETKLAHGKTRRRRRSQTKKRQTKKKQTKKRETKKKQTKKKQTKKKQTKKKI